MNKPALKLILEALLLSTPSPLSLNKLSEAFEDWERPSVKEIEAALIALQEDYKTRSLELKSLASGWVFQTRAEYSAWVIRLQVEKPARYSKALLETLAVIAYKQPVTRADIEDVRGVSLSSHIMKTLLEREWIKVAGHRDVPGKPAVYITTNHFLDYFNLKSIGQLPELHLISDDKDIQSSPLNKELEPHG